MDLRNSGCATAESPPNDRRLGIVTPCFIYNSFEKGNLLVLVRDTILVPPFAVSREIRTTDYQRSLASSEKSSIVTYGLLLYTAKTCPFF
jgi:hypothetical protein